MSPETWGAPFVGDSVSSERGPPADTGAGGKGGAVVSGDCSQKPEAANLTGGTCPLCSSYESPMSEDKKNLFWINKIVTVQRTLSLLPASFI